MIWGAVVVAAGRGERFGRPKQLVEVAGRPLIAAVLVLALARLIAECVVTRRGGRARRAATPTLRQAA